MTNNLIQAETKCNGDQIKKLDSLKSKLQDLQALSAAQAIATWDIETKMPKNGAEYRAWVVSLLTKQSHEMFVSKEIGEALDYFREEANYSLLGTLDKAIVRTTGREYDKLVKVPSNLVQELSELTSKSHVVWAEAKQNNDFKKFCPLLERIFEIKREKAEAIGYKDSPYDALVDSYEPDMTAKQLDPLFTDLKGFLIPFIKQIKDSKTQIDRSFESKKYDHAKQFELSKDVLSYIGYDFDRGRLDESNHPFTIGLGPDDVRLTTRILEDNILSSIGSSIHEGGHALYELGVDPSLAKLGIGSGASLGIHESQSRLYETILGQGLPFWKGYYSRLKKVFPEFESISVEDFYKALNRVEPSFIRVDSDEVTYNLHIVIRYEIERGILEGSLKVKDLPDLWNEKMKEYLGVVPKNDSEGCLQDVHWSWGAIGYFPTYTIGNLCAAQFYNSMNKDINNLESKIESGDLCLVKDWLGDKIHKYGMLEEPNQIIKRVTGEGLNAKYFAEYLKNKYTEIYSL